MIRMEVFSGGPYCAACIDIMELVDEFEEKYRGKLEITRFIGEEGNPKFEEYKLGCVPAVVINGRIRIEGICPSRTTLENALREAGIWTNSK